MEIERDAHGMPEELDWRRRVVLSELGMRTHWFIGLRWWVPPTIVAGTVVATWLGFRIAIMPLLVSALLVLAYNAVFHACRDSIRGPQGWRVEAVHRFAALQVALDYTAMFVIIHFSGGVTSPLVVFVIFHIIFASILLPPRYSYSFAGAVTVGMGVVAAAEHVGWLEFHGLVFGDQASPSPPGLDKIFVTLGFVLAAMVITALMTTAIARMLRWRIRDLAEATREVATLNERLQRVNEQRSRFMRQVAHNLRAPLGAVASMIEVLRDGYLGDLDTDQREQLRRVDRRVHSMLTLINELLSLAASQGMASHDGVEPVDLEVLAGRLDRTFQPTAGDRGVALTIRVDGHVPRVAGNPTLIEQMLENLVSNAIKYTLRDGTVDVVFSTSPSGGARIEVRDTGIGIPRDAMPRLFTEFFRARNAQDLEQVGTGLGLAIVKEVADRMSGNVQVTSTEGTGTTFQVELPAASDGHSNVTQDRDHTS
jgi:signal transduction histidine kinase